jgi:hypothetical protein
MSTEEQQEEIIFCAELLDQRGKVENECVILQSLIDSEIAETSFIWSPDANRVNIIDDIFRKYKRIRESEPEDIVGKNSIEIRFQVDESESDSSQSSISNFPSNSVVPANSHNLNGYTYSTLEIRK